MITDNSIILYLALAACFSIAFFSGVGLGAMLEKASYSRREAKRKLNETDTKRNKRLFGDRLID